MNDWISVDEELPIHPKAMQTRDYETRVVIASSGWKTFPAEFQYGATGEHWWRFVDLVDGIERDVDDWMPLPEARG